MNALRCPQLRGLAPDVALGLLTGEERAAALSHLGRCSSCRADVASLAGVVDEVLLTAPKATPPAGFDHRVLASLSQVRATETTATGLRGQELAHPHQRRPRGGRRRLRPSGRAIGATVAAAAAALILVAAVLVTRGGSGPTEETAQMLTGVGEVVGTATIHGGDPATLTVELPDYPNEARPGITYWLAVELDDGTRTMTRLDTDDSSWEVRLDGNADDVAAVSALAADGWVWCSAEFTA